MLILRPHSRTNKSESLLRSTEQMPSFEIICKLFSIHRVQDHIKGMVTLNN